MSLAADSIRYQQQIRSAVADRVKASLATVNCDVLRSREQPSNTARNFVNVYFLTGEVDQMFGQLGTDGRFIVRLASRNAAPQGGKAKPVDDELSDLAATVLDDLQQDETLGGLVDTFALSSWAYAEPENSSITFLGLEFNVKYRT